MSQHELPATFPKLDNTLGALFIGLIFASILFGITCVQTYTYFMQSMRKDTTILRSLVAFLWILDTVDLAFIAHTTYYYCITNYSNPAALTASYPWSGEGFNIAANLNDVIIRGILIHRIWKISNNSYLAVGLWIGNLTVSAFSLASAIRIELIHSLANLDDISWLFYVVYSLIATEDTILAATLCVILWKKKTGFRRTDTQISTLMKYSINTGALTSLAAICIVVTYVTMPHNFVYIGFFVALPKLYLNALLATLNSRDSVRAEGMDQSFESIDVSKIPSVSPSQSQSRRGTWNNFSRSTTSNNRATVVLIDEGEYREHYFSPDSKA
ncbi:hypothetical protein C8Q75DRAFT_805623 [Abortiporus biennis]|nr:hypothetical protein C8Q75DRAFT_805623 [Abortiporus biennis]